MRVRVQGRGRGRKCTWDDGWMRASFCGGEVYGIVEGAGGEYWIRDTRELEMGYWILDTGYWILDTGY